MNPITKKAWEVLRGSFTKGEYLIVEDATGSFFRGKAEFNKESITLTGLHGNSHLIAWNDVELIAHDGFPVQPLLKMTREEAEARGEQMTAQTLLATLEREQQKNVTAAFNRGYAARGSLRIGGGCPFVAGPCQLLKVHNRGNTGRRFWYSDAEEVLVFQAADGALMHSYDTDHLFLLS